MRKNTPASAGGTVAVAVAPLVAVAVIWPGREPGRGLGRDTGTLGAAPGCGVGGSGGSSGEVGTGGGLDSEPEPGLDVAAGRGVFVGPPGVFVGPPGVFVGPPGVFVGPPGVFVGPPGVFVGPPPEVGTALPMSTATVSEAAVNWRLSCANA
jgi:hypothetical protein